MLSEEVMRRVVNGFTLGPPLAQVFSLELSLFSSSHTPGPVLYIKLHSVDRDNVELKVPLTIRRDLLPYMFDSAEQFFHFVQCLIRELVEHEYAESLKFEGVRFMDPHQKLPRPKLD